MVKNWLLVLVVLGKGCERVYIRNFKKDFSMYFNKSWVNVNQC